MVQRQPTRLIISISGLDDATQAANDHVPRQRPGDVSLTYFGTRVTEPLKGDENRHATKIVLQRRVELEPNLPYQAAPRRALPDLPSRTSQTSPGLAPTHHSKPCLPHLTMPCPTLPCLTCPTLPSLAAPCQT